MELLIGQTYKAPSGAPARLLSITPAALSLNKKDLAVLALLDALPTVGFWDHHIVLAEQLREWDGKAFPDLVDSE